MTRFPLAILTASLAISACATARGTLPPPPTDADLANDGSVEQLHALRERYQVRETPSHEASVGGAVRPVPRFVWGPVPERTELAPDLRAYLASDPDAAEQLGHGPPEWASGAANRALGVFTVLSLMAMPLQGLAVSFPFVIEIQGRVSGTGRDMNSPGMIDIHMGLLLLAIAAGTPATLGLIGSGAAAALISRAENGAWLDAARTFNANLDKRIERARRPASPAPQAPPADPAAGP